MLGEAFVGGERHISLTIFFINVALMMCNFTILSIYTVNNRKKERRIHIYGGVQETFH